ncbi:sigma-70 family RNA polymerase sigma factor [Virgibacillus ndiopensis]|uniref:sigma-70 family RNA polymerase sigma factor n=1 Tax=Virgibacillus ndiopensis TaxID=2004408 RepID=UPI000C0751F0|nr:sigma-70 family RNA polymerase sigma factor [Virgibacillus ndiopensis]
MEEKTKTTFEEILEQNKRRVYYHIRKLKLNDSHQEFYQEGLVAMWNAYEKYQPNKGPLATYFNYVIRNRMIDLMRKQKREQENQKFFVQQHNAEHEDGNYYRNGERVYPLLKVAEDFQKYEPFWDEVKDNLSENQLKWLKYFIIKDMSVKDIALQEGVTVDAVKGWGREVRKKLKE